MLIGVLRIIKTTMDLSVRWRRRERRVSLERHTPHPFRHFYTISDQFVGWMHQYPPARKFLAALIAPLKSPSRSAIAGASSFKTGFMPNINARIVSLP